MLPYQAFDLHSCPGTGLTGLEDDDSDATQTEGEDEGPGGGTQELFDDTLDPLSLLDGMGQQEPGDAASLQPFEVLNRVQQHEEALEEEPVRVWEACITACNLCSAASFLLVKL